MADTNLRYKIGLTPKGNYNLQTPYNILDVVLWPTSDGGNGCSYVSLADNNKGNSPTNAVKWQNLSERGQQGKSAFEVWQEDNPGGTQEQYNAWLQSPASEAAAEVLQELGDSQTSVAGDGSMWGSYKSAEAARDTARSNAEGTASSTAGDGTRWGAYKAAEAARGTAYGTAEGTSESTASDGSRWGAYKTAEAERSAAVNAKADKVTGAIEGNIAQLDDNGNLEDSGIPANNVAQKDGSYDSMAVGIAKNLEGRTNVTDSFFERTTGGDAEVANGLAQMMEVEGKSQVWNQLFAGDNYSERTCESGLKYSIINGHFVGSGTGTGAGTTTSLISSRRTKLVTGHKYYIHYQGSHSGFDLYFYTGGSYGMGVTDITESKIFTADGTSDVNFTFSKGTSGVSFSADCYLYFIDLTLLGIDNLTTVAQVEAWLAENIGTAPYYPYDAGTVLNNNMTGIESYGFNLLDPATGKARIVGAYSDVYGNYYGITGTHGTITFTDDLGNTSTITPDSDGKFQIEVSGELTVATPGADCAVFLWWDGTNTEYEEYDKQTAYLDVTHIYGKKNGTGELVQVWPTGMPGIGELKDALKVVDGQVVAERVIGEADMGSLTWTEYSSGKFRAFSVDEHWASPGICAKYPFSSGSLYNYPVEGTFNFLPLSNYKEVWVSDSRYSDATTFKTAMNGAMVYFSLRTPEVYTDLVYQGSSYFADGTPVTLPVNYAVNNWGIERVIPQNSSEAVVTSAPELTCKYSIDAVELLNTHSDEIEDLYDKIDDLDESKPDKTGDYPGMAVGSAKALEGNDQQSLNLVFNPIAGVSGIAKITDVKGKSLVFNQLANIGSSRTGDVNGITWVIDADKGTVTAKSGGTATSGNSNVVLFAPNLTNGHKYLVAGCPNGGSESTYRMRFGNGSVSELGGGKIITVSNNTTGYLSTQIVSGYTTTVDIVFRPRLINLTLMFGAGNEPSTVAEFEALYPLPYYAYNAGAIINNNTTAIEAAGFNQFDKSTVTEGKTLLNNTGAVVNEPGSWISDWIPALPDTIYYVSHVVSIASGYAVHCYDASKAHIAGKGMNGSGNDVSGTFTTSPGTAYIRIRSQLSVGYQNVCLNISDASRNGQYEPYNKVTVNLNLPTLTGNLDGEGESVTIASDGLKSFGADYDNCVVENGYITKITEKIGRQLVSGAIGDTVTLTGCDTSATTFMCGSDIGTLSGGILTLTAAATNVPVQFKLATPKVYVLDSPILVNFEAQKGGTLKQLPENTSTPTTTCCPLDIIYALDAVGILTNLPTNYDTTASLDALCTELATTLGSALNGTLSITRGAYDAATQKYAFTVTFTPNE